MAALGYYIFFGLNWLITLLPLPLLYIFSDLLYLILRYFPSYRIKVAETNLKNSFPEKPDKELQLIKDRFYRHLADIFIETLKLTHLGKKSLGRRVVYRNIESLEKYYEKGKDIIIVHSHYNNWEWMRDMSLYTKYQVVGVYKPLQNKLFNSFMNKNREKHGSVTSPMNHIIRDIISYRNKNIRSIYGLISDQTPARPYIQYSTTFLNQDTPVFLGIEKIAVKFGMPVIFCAVRKIKRGYYEVTFETLFEDTGNLPEYMITETHVKRLEELICEKPEYWIWTHKRWKYNKKNLNV